MASYPRTVTADCDKGLYYGGLVLHHYILNPEPPTWYSMSQWLTLQYLYTLSHTWTDICLNKHIYLSVWHLVKVSGIY